MRCSTCHATNPDTAAFCGQCYVRFTDDVAVDVPSQPAPMHDSAVDQPRDEDSPDRERMAQRTPINATAGRFRASEGTLQWSCAVCGEANGMGAFACGVCGTRMDAEAADGPDRIDWAAVRRIEALAPGVGHIQAGQTGMGAARGAMVILWAIGVLILVSGGFAGLLTAIPLFIGILAIWVTGPGDLTAAGQGRPPRLDARRFMFLVIGVTAGVITLGGIAIAL